ncbi:hypothetical protein LSTR_LSTR015254 [Laodelphax striatellus]|uniref:Nucleoprotein n=1 Tax=Laodelphax striatellus TaxID=195883 RepID=A0A482XQG6_LAOST|nr:hypothetical protein LSTR_LSTR015254 [Laodelphax striatellus]
MATSYNSIHGEIQSSVKAALNQARQAAKKTSAFSSHHQQADAIDIIPAAKENVEIREIMFNYDDPAETLMVQKLVICLGHHLEKCSHENALEIYLNFYKTFHTTIFNHVAGDFQDYDIDVVEVTLAQFTRSVLDVVGEEDVGKYQDLTHKHACWTGGLIACFIGKYLGDKNHKQWHENRTAAYCTKCGIPQDDPLIREMRFSLSCCSRIYEAISTKSSLRRKLFHFFMGLSSQGTGLLGNALQATMVLLRGAEMTNYMYISYYIANLHPILFGWNELGKYLPAYLAAADKYYQQPAELAPYLKLYLDQSETTEFKSDKLGVLYTVAMAIAKVQGSKTTENIRGYIEPGDLPIVNQALDIVRVYGGSNTVTTQSVRTWDINGLSNKNLIEKISEGANDVTFETNYELPELHADVGGQRNE